MNKKLNPFSSSIGRIWQSIIVVLKGIIKPPFFHMLLPFILLILILILLLLLYCSIGLLIQTTTFFIELIDAEKNAMDKMENWSEKTGSATVLACYYLIITPFLLIQIPFLFFSWMIEKISQQYQKNKFLAFLCLALVLGIMYLIHNIF